MTLLETAVAGTMESSDIMITLSPRAEAGIAIDLSSTVIKQFGQQIRKEIEGALTGLGITSADVTAVDKGAMDCTIRARTRTAARRAAGMAAYPWLTKGENK